jgi:hypothetical protein
VIQKLNLQLSSLRHDGWQVGKEAHPQERLSVDKSEGMGGI